MTETPRTFDIKFDSAGDFDKARELIERMNAELAEWKERAERAETQLAGCGVAALGWNQEPAKEGDWGWSASYQDVLTLRRKWETLKAQIDRVRALADKWDRINPGTIRDNAKDCAAEIRAALGEPAAMPERKQNP